ncbi:MAG: hypothetical protein ABI995_04270 [Acidobacteriota bacterium]
MRTISIIPTAASCSVFSHHLLPDERAFIVTMTELGFGRFEYIQIRGGELVLDPTPVTVRHVKFGTPTTSGKPIQGVSELRQQIAEFFAYVREVDAGEIRTLEIRHGLPFSMEVDVAGGRTTGPEGGCRG